MQNISLIGENLESTIRLIEKACASKNFSTFTKTYIEELDYLLSGIDKSELITFAGECSFMKRKLFPYIASKIAIHNKNVLFIEMINERIKSVFKMYSRILAQKFDNPFDGFNKINFDFKMFEKETIEELVELIENYSKLKPNCIVFIDGIQLLNNYCFETEDYYTVYEKNSILLKKLSKKLNIPIILNIDFSKKNLKFMHTKTVPSIYDGYFENSDKMLIVHKEESEDFTKPIQVCEIEVIKNRYSSCGFMTLKYDNISCDFSNCKYSEKLLL